MSIKEKIHIALHKLCTGKEMTSAQKYWRNYHSTLNERYIRFMDLHIMMSAVEDGDQKEKIKREIETIINYT